MKDTKVPVCLYKIQSREEEYGTMQTILERMEQVGAPPPEFWENDLEMGLGQIIPLLKDPSTMEEWTNRLTGRQINVLCESLGIACDETLRNKRSALKAHDGSLIPYRLVEHFAKFKSKTATIEFASEVLSRELFEKCRIKDEEFDTTALLFAIYSLDPDDLRLVYMLHKIQRSGFARMAMKNSIRVPQGSFHEFLQPDRVKAILKGFDQSCGDQRISEFREVILVDGRSIVFIRRPERPELIIRTEGVVHGYRPEWIILDFSADAKRLNISSDSASVPLEIANRLASAWFGTECEYENESLTTFAKQLDRFLDLIKDDQADRLLFVEIIHNNSPLQGGGKMMLSNEGSIGESVRHFEQVFGSITSAIGDIRSIKVLYHEKRVSLIFESMDGVADGFVVRYSDSRLNVRERRSFEELMRKNHGIPVLSTEKRHKDSARVH
ncbi:MAG: hypothetical protein H7839_20465 [Magnetococcus sp. YQC-5]